MTHPTDSKRPAGVPAASAITRKVVAAAVAGNALEFYDFGTYAFFAVFIGKAFFPASSDFMSLLLTVGVFGVGFVTRPLGGILIGAYGDRAGRKPAMMLTILLITHEMPVVKAICHLFMKFLMKMTPNKRQKLSLNLLSVKDHLHVFLKFLNDKESLIFVICLLKKNYKSNGTVPKG